MDDFDGHGKQLKHLNGQSRLYSLCLFLIESCVTIAKELGQQSNTIDNNEFDISQKAIANRATNNEFDNLFKKTTNIVLNGLELLNK